MQLQSAGIRSPTLTRTPPRRGSAPPRRGKKDEAALLLRQHEPPATAATAAGACLPALVDDVNDLVGVGLDDDDVVLHHEVAIAAVLRHDVDDRGRDRVQLDAARHARADRDREVDVARLSHACRRNVSRTRVRRSSVSCTSRRRSRSPASRRPDSPVPGRSRVGAPVAALPSLCHARALHARRGPCPWSHAPRGRRSDFSRASRASRPPLSRAPWHRARPCPAPLGRCDRTSPAPPLFALIALGLLARASLEPRSPLSRAAFFAA